MWKKTEQPHLNQVATLASLFPLPASSHTCWLCNSDGLCKWVKDSELLQWQMLMIEGKVGSGAGLCQI